MKYLALTLILLSIIACQATQQDSPKGLIVYDNFDDFQHVLQRDDDKVHVVNFWATWCKPCVAELPYFEQLHQRYRQKNVQVTLVSLDFPTQVDAKLRPFIEEHQLSSELFALTDTDHNAWIDKVDSKWSGAIPITLIYKGDKRQFYEREFSYESLEKEVQKFL